MTVNRPTLASRWYFAFSREQNDDQTNPDEFPSIPRVETDETGEPIIKADNPVRARR